MLEELESCTFNLKKKVSQNPYIRLKCFLLFFKYIIWKSSEFHPGSDITICR